MNGQFLTPARVLCVLLCLCVWPMARAADLIYIPFERALQSEAVKAVLKPGIRLQWGSQPLGDEILERSRPDTYTRSDWKGGFASDETKCLRAFASALSATLRDAQLREYDLVIDLHGQHKGRRSVQADAFICEPGWRSTDVVLGSQFALSRTGAAEMAQRKRDPAYLAAIRSRLPEENVLFLPLEPLLASAEAQAILGATPVHVGETGAPAYAERFGPDTYSEDASIRKFGREGACKQAVLNALANMRDDLKSDKYEGLINLRSYYKDRLTPDDKHYECDVRSSSAEVVLLVTLVKFKPAAQAAQSVGGVTSAPGSGSAPGTR